MTASADREEMRKYYQLGLVVLAVVSVTAFVFYKNEYDKLHKVLEVLDIFGNAQQAADEEPHGTEYDFLQDGPTWQRIDDAWYGYAAFYIKGHVKALLIGPPADETLFDCHLRHSAKWPTTQEKAIVIPATTTVQPQGVLPAPDMSHRSLYFATCRASQLPIAVHLVPRGGSVLNYASLPVYKSPEMNTTGRTGVCVLPHLPVPPSKVAEMIAIYKLVGVTMVLFYNSDVLQNTNKAILDSRGYGYATYLYRWNFPFAANDEIATEVVQNDCVHRLAGIADTVIITTAKDLVTPRHHHSLALLFSDYGANIGKFQFPEPHLCGQFPTQDKTHVLAFRPAVLLSQGTPKTQLVSQRVASVHSCKQLLRRHSDIATKFAASLDASPYLKKWT